MRKLAPFLFLLGFARCATTVSLGETNDAGVDGPPPDDASFGQGDAVDNCRLCSNDLHDVLACSDGHVVSHCPAGQGCANGACIPACDAANANKSTFGCDYFTYEIDDIGRKSCYTMFVANTWDADVTLAIDRGGAPLTKLDDFVRIPKGTGTQITYDPLPNGKIPAGKVAIVFLDGDGTGSCEYTGNSCGCPAGVTPPGHIGGLHDTASTSAFHVTTSAPVVAYDIYPYGGGGAAVTSASLLLPTSAWATNYVGVQPWNSGSASIAFIARDDGTAVTIKPTANVEQGNGIMGAQQGVQTTYPMKRGDVLQLKSFGDLSGSIIQSNKPIALWGAVGCTDLYYPACDSMHQQIAPIPTLGRTYAAVRPRDRVQGSEESPPWRLVGAVDGTTLSYVPMAPQGAPTTLAKGQTVIFRAPGPFVVSSQDEKHPFSFSAYMTGCSDPAVGGYLGTEGCAGDPEFVNVIPPDEFMSRYVFFTDPTYPETHLVIVRAKKNGVFEDVTLDCAGTLSGWKAVGDYEYTRFDLVRHDFQGQQGCDNGRHEMTSNGPFGVTIWGWGSKATATIPANYPSYKCADGGFSNQCDGTLFTQAVSYAYPAGMSLRTINPIIVPPN